jgi:hypothetical protein
VSRARTPEARDGVYITGAGCVFSNIRVMTREEHRDWLRTVAIPAEEEIRDRAVARIAELTRELETLEREG